MCKSQTSMKRESPLKFYNEAGRHLESMAAKELEARVHEQKGLVFARSHDPKIVGEPCRSRSDVLVGA